MEEILASISRIVAEDASKAPPPGRKNDVLELTEAVDADGNVRRLTPAQPAGEALAADAPAPVPGRENEPRLDRSASERLVSAATADAAASALGQLAAMPRPARSEDGASGDAAAAGVRTLEQIVGEALRPLLQAWLDEHLPALIEKLVREEVARIVKDAGYG